MNIYIFIYARKNCIVFPGPIFMKFQGESLQYKPTRCTIYSNTYPTRCNVTQFILSGN